MHKPPAAADSPSPFENHEPEIIAAVDLGSNSFHMIDDELRVAILLCFAVRLYRSRKPDVVPVPGLCVAEKGWRWPVTRWLAEYPLTVADLEREQAFLPGAGHKLGIG